MTATHAHTILQDYSTPSRWPRVLWMLIVGSFVLRSTGFTFPFLPYRLSAVCGPSAVACLLAVFGFGGLAGSVTWGWLADRIGQRHTVLISMLVAALAMPTLARATALPAVATTTFLAGATYDSTRPVVSAAIADLVPLRAGRVLVDGWRHFAINAGVATTGVVGALVAHRALTVLYDVNALGCLLFALGAMVFLPAGRCESLRDSAVRRSTARSLRRHAVRDPRLWLLLLASCCALTCCAGLYSALPLMMSAAALDAGAYGWTQVTSGVTVLALTPLIVPWMARRAQRGSPLADLLAVAALVLGAGMAMAGLVTNTVGYSMAAAVLIVGEILLFSAATNLVSVIAPTPGRGLYAGVWGGTMSASLIVTPLVTSWSLATGGPLLASVVFLLIGLVGAALSLPLAALLGPSSPAGTGAAHSHRSTRRVAGDSFEPPTER